VRVDPAARTGGLPRPGRDRARRGSARPAPKRGAPAGLSGEAAWAKSDLRPMTSGRDGPEHPAAVPEVPRHCRSASSLPRETATNRRILSSMAGHLLSQDLPAQGTTLFPRLALGKSGALRRRYVTQ